jgi:hypothetical protein
MLEVRRGEILQVWRKCEVPAWLAHVRYRGNSRTRSFPVTISEG